MAELIAQAGNIAAHLTGWLAWPFILLVAAGAGVLVDRYITDIEDGKRGW